MLGIVVAKKKRTCKYHLRPNSDEKVFLLRELIRLDFRVLEEALSYLSKTCGYSVRRVCELPVGLSI